MKTPGANRPVVRWGILGTAQIARKNWLAIHNSGNSTVAAVASRELERSRHFIADCQHEAPFESAPRAIGSYEELIAAPDIDALYIPLPTGIRKEWVLRATEAGKHVVCEKPCAISVADLIEMLDACQKRGVQFMDGVMFMHSRRLERMLQVLNDGQTVGSIKRISATFNFSAPEEFFRANIRSQPRLEPHGCLGDLGWYCIRFILWVMDGKLPNRVTGRILSQSTGAVGGAPATTEFAGELFFEGGVSSIFYCSFVSDLQQSVTVTGTRGCLQVQDFVLPFCGDELVFETWTPVHRAQGCDFKIEPNPRRWLVDERSNSHPTAQETNLFRNFAEQILAGRLNSAWPEMALKTQQVMEACLDSALADGRIVELGRP